MNTWRNYRDHPEAIKELIRMNQQRPHLVSCTRRGIELYLTVEGLASDMRDHAKVYENWKTAAEAADNANTERAWINFDWRVERK